MSDKIGHQVWHRCQISPSTQTISLSHCSFNKPGLLTQWQHNTWYRVMGRWKATSLCCVVALAISGAALQLDGNWTDSFTLKGGLDKTITSANLQQGGCEMLGIIQLIQHTVMNTAAHCGSNRVYSAVLWTQHHTVAVIQLIVHSVMNTAAHYGSNTAYSAQCYEHNSTLWQ